MTTADTLRVVTTAAEAYGVTLPKERLRVYVQMLDDLPAEALMVATKAHMATGKWFPSVAELRALATEARGEAIPDAHAAWGEVIHQIARVGSYGVPEFSHRAIKATVDAIGWRTLCLSEEQMADRAHFLRLYGTCRDRTERDAALPPAVREALTPLAERLALTEGETRDPG